MGKYKPGDYPYWEVNTFENWRQYGVPNDAAPDELIKYWDYVNTMYPYQYSAGQDTNAGWSQAANSYATSYSGHTYPGYNSTNRVYGYVPPATTSGPSSYGYAPPGVSQQPASGTPNANHQQPAPQQNTGFSAAQWDWLKSRQQIGTMSQYNYLGDTLGQANTPEGGSQPGGWDQLNRYGQPLGTPGPLNNKRVSTRINWGGSAHGSRFGGTIVTPWNNGPGPTGNGSNPTKDPTKGGGGGGEKNDTTYSNDYNSLINWRI